MSLGNVYLVCDDGYCYDVNEVFNAPAFNGEPVIIELNEFKPNTVSWFTTDGSTQMISILDHLKLFFTKPAINHPNKLGGKSKLATKQIWWEGEFACCKVSVSLMQINKHVKVCRVKDVKEATLALGA